MLCSHVSSERFFGILALNRIVKCIDDYDANYNEIYIFFNKILIIRNVRADCIENKQENVFA